MAHSATSERQQVIAAFLMLHGLEGARCIALPSDASFRHYHRVMAEGRQFIVMDAPPPTEDVRPFIKVDHYLRQCGFSAPAIYAEDVDKGLLLLEDLGDDRFTSLLMQADAAQQEKILYQEAVATLLHLHTQPLPEDFPVYSHEYLMREIGLLVEWYLPAIQGARDADEHKKEYIELWNALLTARPAYKPVAVLRDYHADNLMWLPRRKGIERVGILDFQDAVIGHPVYDLISLLEDARRDVGGQTVEHVKAYYVQHITQECRATFEGDYALYAAQRNCKILGIFARLAIRDHKPRYLHYISRVWKHLEHDLAHPSLGKLRDWFERVIPQKYRVPEALHVPSAQGSTSLWA